MNYSRPIHININDKRVLCAPRVHIYLPVFLLAQQWSIGRAGELNRTSWADSRNEPLTGTRTLTITLNRTLALSAKPLLTVSPWQLTVIINWTSAPAHNTTTMVCSAVVIMKRSASLLCSAECNHPGGLLVQRLTETMNGVVIEYLFFKGECTWTRWDSNCQANCEHLVTTLHTTWHNKVNDEPSAGKVSAHSTADSQKL
jgi:hypothetical protein